VTVHAEVSGFEYIYINAAKAEKENEISQFYDYRVTKENPPTNDDLSQQNECQNCATPVAGHLS
jgi:hypothetical protein